MMAYQNNKIDISILITLVIVLLMGISGIIMLIVADSFGFNFQTIFYGILQLFIIVNSTRGIFSVLKDKR